MPRFWPERVAKCIYLHARMYIYICNKYPSDRKPIPLLPPNRPATASAFTIKQFPLNLVTSLAICYARQQSYVTLCHKFMRQPRLPLFVFPASVLPLQQCPPLNRPSSGCKISCKRHLNRWIYVARHACAEGTASESAGI